MQDTLDTRGFESYLIDVLDGSRPLPPFLSKIGQTEVEWWPVGSSEYHLLSEGGTHPDRAYAEYMVRSELEDHGLRRASYEYEGFIKQATWDEVREKAKRLIETGKVKLNRNGYNFVDATVEGDHGTYHVEFSREDPESRAVSQWKCDCPWGQVSWGRTRQWKKYEGRSCAHNIAAYWLSLATPLDEDIEPGGGEQQPQGPPPQPPGEGAFGEQGQQPPLPGMQPPGTPGYGEPAPGQANPLIPPYPYNPENVPQVNPISMPGQKEQTPLNPLQMPMTFSKVAAEEETFVNGEMVSTVEDEIGTTVGLNSGQQKLVPKNSVGEVLGVDPLGLVNVYFAGPQSSAGRLEPHGVTAWFWPGQLRKRPDVSPPGPATRRTKTEEQWQLK